MSFSRRSFLKYGFATIASASYLSRFGSPLSTTALAADNPLAKETEEPAKSLKFCADAEKPSKNCAARKAKDKAGQFCYNCQLFTKSSGEKKAAIGKCMIMPKSSVPGKAWCQSWIKNPAVSG
jgi:uncharacterized protein YifE (UPF0438 family)